MLCRSLRTHWDEKPPRKKREDETDEPMKEKKIEEAENAIIEEIKQGPRPDISQEDLTVKIENDLSESF